MPNSCAFELKFEINALPKILSNGAQGDWRAKAQHVARWKRSVVLAVGNQRPEAPLERAHIKCVRHSSREPDHDNLTISFKPVIDGLRLAGVIIDDKRVNIGKPDYDWVYAPQKKGFISIEVREIL